MPIIIVFFILGIIFIIFAKASVINVPAHMKVSDIKKCIKILGRGYSKIDCAIYFINNQNDFNKYAKNKISGFYSEYMDGSLHGLCCYNSNSTSHIFVFTNNTINAYGLNRCFYQKSIIRVLYHELRHAYQHKHNLNITDLELDAIVFADRTMHANETKLNHIFKNYMLYK